MKKMIVTLTCMCSVLGAASATSLAKVSADESKRLSEAATVLRELRNTPEGIPQDLWNRAQCVVVIPSMKKAAFVIGGEYGSGVMSCRTTNDWSAPVFMQLAKGSVGFQIGAQQTDLVLLVMNRSGLQKLLTDKVTLGADASIAAGPVGRSGAAATDAQLGAEILSYSRSQGLFAGINLSGGVLKADKDADARAYGSNVNANDIALGTRQATLEPATPFIQALRQNSGATTTPAN
jgi:lipid-binding SYLF domain-containing protein